MTARVNRKSSRRSRSKKTPKTSSRWSGVSRAEVQNQTFSWIIEQARKQGKPPTLKQIAAYAEASSSTVDNWIKKWKTDRFDPRDPPDDFENGTGEELGIDPQPPQLGPGDPQSATPDPGKTESEPSDPPSQPTLIFGSRKDEISEEDPTHFDGSRRFEWLTIQQERATFLKAEGRDNAVIARRLGVSRQTVSQWMHSAPVKRAVEMLVTEMHREGREALRSLATESVYALAEAQREMRRLLEGDVTVSYDWRTQRAMDQGQDVTVMLDARTKIAAARAINQISRSLMDRGGFAPARRQEIHHSGGVDVDVRLDLAGVDTDELEARYEREQLKLEEEEAELDAMKAKYEDVEEYWEEAG